MTVELVFVVFGTPRPQGSLRLFRSPKTQREVAKYANTTIEWRNRVQADVREQLEAMDHLKILGEVTLRLDFEMPRPKHHFGTGRNAGLLKPSAPHWPTNSGGDLDKLVRAINDALTDAGVWVDDAQVVEIQAVKRYADPPSEAGVTITLRELDEP